MKKHYHELPNHALCNWDDDVGRRIVAADDDGLTECVVFNLNMDPVPMHKIGGAWFPINAPHFPYPEPCDTEENSSFENLQKNG
jgi:hypothetical protein